MNVVPILVKQVIERVIIGELGQIIYGEEKSPAVINQQSAYTKFLPVMNCIEFLGACYDELPFTCTRLEKLDIVEQRFNKALKNLFPNEYLPLTKKNHKYYWYTKFRCNMLHQLVPGNGIMLTTRKEAVEDGNTHLKLDCVGNQIVVLEDLYDHLALAAQRLLRGFKNGKITNKKGDLHHFDIVYYTKRQP